MTTLLSCATCKHDKPPESYHPRTDTKRGYRSNCKSCEAALCKAAYVRRKAKAKKRARSKR